MPLLGCGGSSSPAAPAQEARRSKPVVRESQALEPAPEPQADERAVSRCADGLCFACGEAVCLAGYYCAVGRNGHGCAWLPTCATRPSCSCLASSLRETPSCRCEERDGGVFVFCDGAKL